MSMLGTHAMSACSASSTMPDFQGIITIISAGVQALGANERCFPK